MEFSVRHDIPGRIRLHVPALSAAPADAIANIVAWLTAQDGIRQARINPACASLVVTYDAARGALLRSMLVYLGFLSPRDLIALMAEAVPPPAPLPQPAPAQPPATLGPEVLVLPSVSLALAFMSNPVTAALNVPLMIWNAWPIARRAWGVWSRESRLNVDFLDTLAIAASIGQGLMITGGIITWLIRLGDWIRDLTARGSKRAIAELMEFQSRSAWLLRDGSVVAVPAAQLAAGDLVVVYPGEMIPVDGAIVDGDAMSD